MTLKDNPVAPAVPAVAAAAAAEPLRAPAAVLAPEETPAERLDATDDEMGSEKFLVLSGSWDNTPLLIRWLASPKAARLSNSSQLGRLIPEIKFPHFSDTIVAADDTPEVTVVPADHKYAEVAEA